jgi:hypothetical protein
MTTQLIRIADKSYDLANPSEQAEALTQLVPLDWPGEGVDCLKLFQATTEMLCLKLRRHLARNWRNICRTSIREMEDDNPAKVPITFAFEIDQTVLTTAAISKHVMSFSMKYKSKGRPETCDIKQTDFLDQIESGHGEEQITEEQITEEEPEIIDAGKITQEADGPLIYKKPRKKRGPNKKKLAPPAETVTPTEDTIVHS